MTRFLTLCLAGLLLSACATTPSRQQSPAQSQALWQQRINTLTPLTDWSIRGRVALYVDDEVYNLGLGWQRQGAHSNLTFEASLGQGLVRLEKNASAVELTTAEGDLYQGSNAQQVLLQSTGLNIPVEGLETWIKGIPHPNSEFQPELDGQGRASSLLQDGWQINYLDYQEQSLSALSTLPRRLYMKHDGLALKIVIDQWQNSSQPIDAGLFPSFPD